LCSDKALCAQTKHFVDEALCAQTKHFVLRRSTSWTKHFVLRQVHSRAILIHCNQASEYCFYLRAANLSLAKGRGKNVRHAVVVRVLRIAFLQVGRGTLVALTPCIQALAQTHITSTQLTRQGKQKE
jgi:hypothetical protein